MGTITIINGTNVPINSAISAGVNYSFCNHLSPGTYYIHEGGAGVFTLNAKYWKIDGPDYGQNVDEIGLFAGAVVVGIVGMVLAPMSGGSSMLIAASLIAGAGGLAVTGMALGVKDYRSTPAAWTNIQALSNRVFIAEGHVTITEKDGNLDFTAIPPVTLREVNSFALKDLAEHQTNEADEEPIINHHLTARELREAKLLDTPLRIFPSLGGDACWEIENDSRADAARLQLWARKQPEVLWRIQALTDDDSATIFRIYNQVLDRYVQGSESSSSGSDMVFARSKEYVERFKSGFHIVKSTIERVKGKPEDFYAFLNTSSVDYRRLAIVPEDGNLGNSTKLVMRPLDAGRPSWARWRLDSGAL